MSGDRYDPHEIAAQAGGTWGTSEPNELDNLAAEPSLPESQDVVGHGDIRPLAPNQIPGIAPPIGSGEESLHPDFGSKQHKDSLIAQNIINKAQTGKLDEAISLSSDIHDERVRDLIRPSIEDALSPFVQGLIHQHDDKLGIVDTMTFEGARLQVAGINDNSLRQKAEVIIDEHELNDIVYSDQPLNMKVILAFRLSGTDKRRQCVAASCGTIINDQHPRTESEVNQIIQVLQAIKMKTENINVIAADLRSWSNSNDRPNITVVNIVRTIRGKMNDERLM